MDAAGRVAILKSQKGMAMVYFALLMVVFFAFLGLAVDVGYMYLTRGQLQNAADAAALAGASRLVAGETAQPAAREEATRYAAQNIADLKTVEISDDDSNALSEKNDITVGNWDRTKTPNFSTSRSPVNAIQVRARRTAAGDVGGESAGGPVKLFFAKVLDERWKEMGVSAVAIAQRPPKAGFYIMVGSGVCGASGEVVLTPAAGNMAWTSLLQPSTNANDIKDNFICPADRQPRTEVCGEKVYTTNGVVADIFKAVEVDFNDPDYDRANKNFDAGGNVTGWTVIVPVSTVSDPSTQPSPQGVWGYARVVITRACGTGGGNPCSGRISLSAGGCSGGENDIVISSVYCVPCERRDELFGTNSSLVY